MWQALQRLWSVSYMRQTMLNAFAPIFGFIRNQTFVTGKSLHSLLFKSNVTLERLAFLLRFRVVVGLIFDSDAGYTDLS
jgi:hypothetical protein